MTSTPLPVSDRAARHLGHHKRRLVAHLFAADLDHVPDARLVAIGSRSEEKARAFANRFAIRVALAASRAGRRSICASRLHRHACLGA